MTVAAISWDDFLLWLEHRYPRRPGQPAARIEGVVVLRVPGALIVRVSVDGEPRAVQVASPAWQRFAPGDPVLLTREGDVYRLGGRTAGSRVGDLGDEPGGFVAPLPVSRESPQMPQPGHAPGLEGGGEFRGDRTGDGSAGFDSGILLDDASIDYGPVAQIDHAARRFRRFSGEESRESTIESQGRPVQFVTQAEIDAATGLAAPRGAQRFEFDLPYKDVHYLTVDDYRTRFDDQLMRRIEPVGLCLLAGYGSRPSVASPSRVEYTRSVTYTEQPGRTFDGRDVPYPPTSASDHGSFMGQLVGRRVVANTGYTIVGPFQKPDSGSLDFWRYTQYTDEYDVADDVQLVVWAYRYEGSQYYDRFLISPRIPAGPLTFASFVGPGDAAQVVTLGGAPAGVVVESAEYLPVGYGSQYVAPAGATGSYGVGLYKGDPTATYSSTPAVRPVWAVDARPPEPVAPRPTAGYTFRSQPSGPRRLSFQLTTTPLSQANPTPMNLQGIRPQVAGRDVPGDWGSWSAFQDAAGAHTLLLGDALGLLVVPGLDLDRAVRVSWRQLLVDLRQPAGVEAVGLGIHPGFHSFPEDRAYLLIGSGGARHWVALGPWDAYRDVSSKEWRAAGLSKPRTREAFETGQRQQPPARLPPRPAHGLSLWDVYAGQGDAS